MKGGFELLQSLDLQFVMQPARELWANSRNDAKQIARIHRPTQPVEIGPAPGVNHFGERGGDAASDPRNCIERLHPALGQQFVKPTVERRDSIGSASVGTDPEGIVALTGEETRRLAQPLCGARIDFGRQLMKIITHAGEPPSTKIGQIRARPKALLQLSARIALGLALAISSAQQRIAEVISHTAILPRQPAFHMDSFRAVLGSEEWRIPSICALIQIKHPTGRRRVHCGRRQRPPVRLWKSDAMGVRAIDRGVKGCIYLNGTQRAENERATVSRDLTEMPGVDVRASAPTHLKSYQIHAVNSAPAPRIFPHRASSARTTISSRSRVLRALRGGRGIQAQFRGPIWQRRNSTPQHESPTSATGTV